MALLGQPTGMERIQSPEELEKLKEIENTAFKSMPSDLPVPKKPFQIQEDVYMEDTQDQIPIEDQITTALEQVDPMVDEIMNNQDIYKALDSVDDIVNDALGSIDPEVSLMNKQEQMELDNDKFDPEAQFIPKSYKEFMLEKQNKSTEIDPLGFMEGTLLKATPMAKLGKVAERWIVDTFLDAEQKIDVAGYSPSSLAESRTEGRQVAIGLIDQKLSELGNVKVGDYENVRKAKELWGKKYELMYQNQMDKAMLEAGTPTVKEFVELVQEDPDTFFKAMLQEVINKPELVLLPEVAAARGAAVAGMAAKGLGAGKTAMQVAKVAGGITGAGGGGFTLGTLEGIIEQSNSSRDIDVAKAMDQAKVDAILGVVLYGGERVLTKGVKGVEAHRTAKANARALEKESLGSSEKNLQALRDNSKVQELFDEPNTETYIDDGGNVYTFEIKETTDKARIREELKELSELQRKYNEDPQALEALDMEIEVKTKELAELDINSAEFDSLSTDIKHLATKRDEYDNPKDIVNKWYLRGEGDVVRTQDFMKFPDSDGIEHTLRRLTPEVLREGQVNVQGISGLDMSGKFNVTKANNKVVHAFYNYAVSATAPLRKLTETSPTAKLLLDTVSPKSTLRGRAPIWDIQENMAYTQGQWRLKSKDIQAKLQPLGKGGEEALRKHMRGVKLSKDPTILEAAKGYRELLEEAKSYAESKGVKVAYNRDFLPRYYDRAKLKTPEAQERLAQIVSSITDKEGNLIHDFEQAKRSARDIAMNINKESDEAGRFIKGDTMQPVGFRKWDDVPDAMLDEFLNENFIDSINRYLMNAAQRTEVDAVFGYNGKKLKDWKEQIMKETEEAGRFVDSKELDAIDDIYDLLQGRYGGKKSDYKGVTDTILAAESIAKLPFVTLTSILEPTTLLFRLNESTGVRGLVNSMGGRHARKLFGKPAGKGTRYDDMSIADIEREVQEVGLVHDAAMQEKLDAMVGEGLEGFPQKISTFTMKAFMLHQWTEHVRTIGYEAARNDVLKTIKRLADKPTHKDSTLRRRWLSDNNIDPDLAMKWIEEGGKVDDPFYTTVKRGAARMTNAAVANPNKLNKAKWLSSNRSVFRLLAQFKPFGSVFSNEIINPTYTEVVKLWNDGYKIRAMRKAGAMFAAVGAMAYWTGYKSSLLYDYLDDWEIDEPVGGEKEEEVALKMTKGTAGMLVPGASFIAPLAGARDLSGIAGPFASDVQSMLRASSDGEVKLKELKPLAPSYFKTAEALVE